MDARRAAYEAIIGKRYALAVMLLEPLVAQEDEWAIRSLAWIRLNGPEPFKDVTEAARLYGYGAARGSLESRFGLAKVSLDVGDLGDAVTRFAELSELGHVGAMYRLGVLQIRGVAGPSAVDEGVENLSRAAKRGNWLAQREVALMMLKGRFGHWRRPVGALLFVWWFLSGLVRALQGNRDVLSA